MSEFGSFNAHELLSRMRTGGLPSASLPGSVNGAPSAGSSVQNVAAVGNASIGTKSANNTNSQSRNQLDALGSSNNLNNINTATNLFLQSQGPHDFAQQPDPFPKGNPELSAQVIIQKEQLSNNYLFILRSAASRTHGNSSGA